MAARARLPRFDWDEAIRDHPRLTNTQKHVGLTLATYMNGNTLETYVSVPTLAQACGGRTPGGSSNERTVRDATRRIEEEELLTIVVGGGRHNTNLYRGRLPSSSENGSSPIPVSDSETGMPEAERGTPEPEKHPSGIPRTEQEHIKNSSSSSMGAEEIRQQHPAVWAEAGRQVTAKHVAGVKVRSPIGLQLKIARDLLADSGNVEATQEQSGQASDAPRGEPEMP